LDMLENTGAPALRALERCVGAVRYRPFRT
jgi:hypothetical protein